MRAYYKKTRAINCYLWCIDGLQKRREQTNPNHSYTYVASEKLQHERVRQCETNQCLECKDAEYTCCDASTDPLSVRRNEMIVRRRETTQQ
jgi:hypothetical protein